MRAFSLSRRFPRRCKLFRSEKVQRDLANANAARFVFFFNTFARDDREYGVL